MANITAVQPIILLRVKIWEIEMSVRSECGAMGAGAFEKWDRGARF
jgi:hypothetical protein